MSRICGLRGRRWWWRILGNDSGSGRAVEMAVKEDMASLQATPGHVFATFAALSLGNVFLQVEVEEEEVVVMAFHRKTRDRQAESVVVVEEEEEEEYVEESEGWVLLLVSLPLPVLLVEATIDHTGKKLFPFERRPDLIHATSLLLENSHLRLCPANLSL